MEGGWERAVAGCMMEKERTDVSVDHNFWCGTNVSVVVDLLFVCRYININLFLGAGLVILLEQVLA